MTRLIALSALFLAIVGGGAAVGLADMPPPYDPYGIGSRLVEAEPFPQLADMKAGSPAANARLKNGDAVIAIDGDYSKSGRVPFYFFARGMQGPKGSAVTLVILRDGRRVFTVRIPRTVPLRSNW